MQVTPKLFDHFLLDYQCLSTIGFGPQSCTFKVLSKSSAKAYALKVFSFHEDLDSSYLERFDGQMPRLCEISGRHLERVFHSGRSNFECFVVKDLVTNQESKPFNLRDYQKSLNGCLSDYQAFVVLEQCLKALRHVYQNYGLSHGALKPENILIEDAGEAGINVILSDFQPFKLFSDQACFASRYQMQGSLKKAFSAFDYRAPEYEKNEHASVAEDIFSLATILYEMMSNKLPWGRFSLISPYEEILKIALSQDPNKRYASYEDFYQALTKLFEAPVKALPPLQKMRKDEGLTPIGTVYVPKGSYFIGRDDCGQEAKPVHEVTSEGFYIARNPVTNAEFAAFVAETGYQTQAEKENAAPYWTGSEWKMLEGLCWKNPRGQALPKDFDRHPVVQVSYEDALAYATYLGRRLPLEQEWEIAAKGGRAKTLYPSGEQLSSHQANFASTSTSAVMTYPPNSYGLYDMAGNVWEWCSSPYLPYPGNTSNAKEQPLGFSEELFVVRGGAWLYDLFHCRVGARNANHPQHFYPTLGFRTVCDAKNRA